MGVTLVNSVYVKMGPTVKAAAGQTFLLGNRD
jgi:hypothetical protein